MRAAQDTILEFEASGPGCTGGGRRPGALVEQDFPDTVA